jgi:hypothetical protein
VGGYPDNRKPNTAAFLWQQYSVKEHILYFYQSAEGRAKSQMLNAVLRKPKATIGSRLSASFFRHLQLTAICG